MQRFLVLLILPFLMSACAEEGHYPVSGEECQPGDPVQELSAADCVVLPAGTGTH